MATGTAPQVEEYRYRNQHVQLLASEGALRQIAYPGNEPFWVRFEKVKVIKPKRVHRHEAPFIESDPFVVWLLQQSITLRADCPPQFFPSLSSTYEIVTGVALTKDAPYLSVRDNDKSWGYSLYVDFPRPPAHLKPVVHVSERHSRAVSTCCSVANNEFVFGLLALGLRLGSNQPLKAQ